MEIFLETLRQYDIFIMAAIAVLLIILIVMQIVNKIHFKKLDRQYKKLFRNTKSNTIEDMIVDYGSRVEEILDYTKEVHRAYKGLDERVSGCTQKVGIIRYKAFDDIGSDLSYSVALLDDSDTGVVITGIYGRSECTTFAKPIDNGISKYDLSEEELEAIGRAQKSYEYHNRNRMTNIDELENIKPYKAKNDDYENEYDEEYDDYDESDDYENYEDYNESAYDDYNTSEDFK